uniref:NADH-ubiquinone oxidoreductase chain 2 n=2 Tax=Pericapritermes TaxID=64671 RepID=A0A1S5VMI6_9NEOP|nr:NADH dehydrogenase subunit 2 [Pericapritermes dolichocephalus]AQP27155.1 NADH dehydrogenase subunit 2 [Pericapritermes sp. 4 TB-2017]AQP29236.1 NADH dehydrogenase subunit 2 [Pericapritermes dolichocephalus]
MPSNSTKVLLLLTLVGGMLVSVSSNSWLGAWMGLEINLMSFIPLMSNVHNMYNTEASLKYFIVQVLASATLLFLVVMKVLMEDLFTFEMSPYTSVIISTPLLLKSGAAPFHWWFPGVMEGLSWGNCMLLMTVQKAAPLMLISYLIEINTFTLSIILMSTIVGAIGGLNQNSMRKILTYSSINHTGWMLIALTTSENLWLVYFMIYSTLTLAAVSAIKLSGVSFINQTMLTNKETTLTKFMMFTSLLSLGGLPPFLGFLPKWIVIQAMVMNNMVPLATVAVLTSLITLYYYLKISYSSFLILNAEPKWNLKTNKNKMSTNISALILSSISLMGLAVCTIVININ